MKDVLLRLLCRLSLKASAYLLAGREEMELKRDGMGGEGQEIGRGAQGQQQVRLRSWPLLSHADVLHGIFFEEDSTV